ncbi:MAG: hypothetical protein P9L99_01100 [Candidatus Lernaella stagnicola]|nr:hypothetical protein [Candidatus Lernaella stagnicola]
MSRNLAISIGFVAVFVLLAVIGTLFGDAITSPVPGPDDHTFSMPKDILLVAPQDEIRRETDTNTGKARIVAPNGFTIVSEVPAKYEPPVGDVDPCNPPPPKDVEMTFKHIRDEDHFGAVVAADVKVENRDGKAYVRVPSGGTLIERKMSWHGFWTWFAAFLTLCILSFLYDDNPFYKFAEHLFVGVSAAYWMVVGFWTVIVPNLMGKLWPSLVAKINPGIAGVERNLLYLIPLAFGVLLLFRLSNKLGWLSRWSLAFIVGTTAGLNFVGYLQSDFVGQIEGAIRPLVLLNADGNISLGGTFSAIVMLIGVLASLIYFFFSTAHKGLMGVASRVGIWVLMVTFGASFGYTVMGRIALLVGRMEFLFADWLHIIIK